MSRFFTALTEHHQRDEFHSGEPVVDDWFRGWALEAQLHRHSARTFVLVDDEVEGASRPLAYFSLAAHAVDQGDLPDDLGRRQPRLVPAALLARLGRDQRWRREGLGEAALKRAIRTVLEGHQYVAMPIVVVDAANDTAQNFYSSYGFVILDTEGERARLAARTLDLAATLE